VLRRLHRCIPGTELYPSSGKGADLQRRRRRGRGSSSPRGGSTFPEGVLQRLAKAQKAHKETLSRTFEEARKELRGGAMDFRNLLSRDCEAARRDARDTTSSLACTGNPGEGPSVRKKFAYNMGKSLGGRVSRQEKGTATSVGSRGRGLTIKNRCAAGGGVRSDG